MKTSGIYVLALVMLMASACRKDHAIADEKAMVGIYAGALDYYDNSYADSTPVQVRIQILPSITKDQMSIEDGVLMSSTIKLSGSSFSMEPTTVAAADAFTITEYASGRVSGRQLYVVFHQDRRDSSGKLAYFKEWRGSLYRQ